MNEQTLRRIETAFWACFQQATHLSDNENIYPHYDSTDDAVSVDEAYTCLTLLMDARQAEKARVGCTVEVIMKRYLTTYELASDEVKCFTEEEDYETAVAQADDWVWHFAPDRDTAIEQHFTQLDAWKMAIDSPPQQEAGLVSKGTAMPQTTEEWKYLAEQYGRRIEQDADTMRDLRIKLNKAQQRAESFRKQLRALESTGLSSTTIIIY